MVLFRALWGGRRRGREGEREGEGEGQREGEGGVSLRGNLFSILFLDHYYCYCYYCYYSYFYYISILYLFERNIHGFFLVNNKLGDVVVLSLLLLLLSLFLFHSLLFLFFRMVGGRALRKLVLCILVLC